MTTKVFLLFRTQSVKKHSPDGFMHTIAKINNQRQRLNQVKVQRVEYKSSFMMNLVKTGLLVWAVWW